MDLSVLIVSFKGSEWHEITKESIINTMPKNVDYEILEDIEDKRSNISNTPARWQRLFRKSKGDYIIKSDDDVLYFEGGIEKAIKALKENPTIPYIGLLDMKLFIKMRKQYTYSYNIPMEKVVPEKDELEIVEIMGGACWIFRRDLWIKCPYSLVNGRRRISSFYTKKIVFYELGYSPAYFKDSAYIFLLGFDRHKGVDVSQLNKPGFIYPPIYSDKEEMRRVIEETKMKCFEILKQQREANGN